MEETTLFSIGHGQKPIGEFISELQTYRIEIVIDVRSMPYSKWAPQYNWDALKAVLNSCNLKYAYWGNLMGGRPTLASCFDTDGYFDYKAMAQTTQFKEGLMRLVEAHNQQKRVAIMCSETNPAQCHRSKLIGRELYAQNQINMQHIVAVGKILTEVDILKMLTKNTWNPQAQSLFAKNEPPYFKSGKPYKKLIPLTTNP